MPTNITNTELLDIVENDEAAQYFGTFEVGAEKRKYYRTTTDSGDLDKGYRVVYVVV